jgi:hypothetical protein
MPAFSNQSVEIQKPIGSNKNPLVNVIRVSKGECPIGLSRSRFGRSGLKSRTMGLAFGKITSKAQAFRSYDGTPK